MSLSADCEELRTQKSILEQKKLIANSVYVDRCTTEDELIVRDIRTLKGRKLDYLSLLIVRK